MTRAQSKVQMTDADSDGSVKVGDTVDLDRAAALVRQPDGTVATCRGAFTPRHEGEHIVYATDDDDKLVVIRTITVGKAVVKR